MGEPAHKVLLALRKGQSDDGVAGWLEHLGYRVMHANDGATALLLAHREQPDVAVVDAELPILNGFQFTAALQGDGNGSAPRCPVVLLVPDGQAATVARGCGVGADLVLPRNLSRSDLQLALERILGAAGRRPAAEAPHPVPH